jgi:hypothetical protein
MPFGGWKQSGIGREKGFKALNTWLEVGPSLLRIAVGLTSYALDEIGPLEISSLIISATNDGFSML